MLCQKCGHAIVASVIVRGGGGVCWGGGGLFVNATRALRLCDPEQVAMRAALFVRENNQPRGEERSLLFIEKIQTRVKKKGLYKKSKKSRL